MFKKGKKEIHQLILLITNLIPKLEKYNAVKDNYRSILIINIDGRVLK